MLRITSYTRLVTFPSVVNCTPCGRRTRCDLLYVHGNRRAETHAEHAAKPTSPQSFFSFFLSALWAFLLFLSLCFFILSLLFLNTESALISGASCSSSNLSAIEGGTIRICDTWPISSFSSSAFDTGVDTMGCGRSSALGACWSVEKPDLKAPSLTPPWAASDGSPHARKANRRSIVLSLSSSPKSNSCVGWKTSGRKTLCAVGKKLSIAAAAEISC